MEFETNRLIVREFTLGDTVHIHRIASTDGFIFYNLDGTLETSEAFVERAVEFQGKNARDSFKMAVEDKSRPGHCIGYVSIDDIGHEGQAPDIGYLIDPREQGKGFATEAMIGLMQTTFLQHPDIGEVWLTVHPDNLASQGVARKLTFEYVGDKTIETARGTEPRLIYKTDQDRFTGQYGALEAVMEM